MHRGAAPLLVVLASVALVACGGHGSDNNSQ